MLKKLIQGSLYRVASGGENRRVSCVDTKGYDSHREQARPGTLVEPDAVATVRENRGTEPSRSARAEHSLSQEIPHHAPYLLRSSSHRRERVRGSSATGTRAGARERLMGTGVPKQEDGDKKKNKKHLNKGNGSRNDEGTKRRRTDTDTDTVGVDGKNKQKQGIYQTADKLTSN